MEKKEWFTSEKLAEQYGIKLVAMTTRFDETEYFIEDRNTLDEDGLPTVIFQTGDYKKAINYFLTKLEAIEAAMEAANGTR